MRGEHYKQIACISETDPQIFEQKVNTILAGIINPEIILDRVKPFTVYILYRVKKDVPEDLLELCEMIDGKSHACKECPYFSKSTDKRKKWHKCTRTGAPTREDSRACEEYYRQKVALNRDLVEEYRQIPYTVE